MKLRFGSEADVRFLLERGADPNRGPIKFMPSASMPALVALLLEHGWNINEGDGQRTLLHHDANHGHGKKVRVLLDFGADPNVRDAAGRARCTWWRHGGQGARRSGRWWVRAPMSKPAMPPGARHLRWRGKRVDVSRRRNSPRWARCADFRGGCRCLGGCPLCLGGCPPARVGVPGGVPCSGGCPLLGWVSPCSGGCPLLGWVSPARVGVPCSGGCPLLGWVSPARVGVPCSGGCPLLGWVSPARVGVPCSGGCPLLGWVSPARVGVPARVGWVSPLSSPLPPARCRSAGPRRERRSSRPQGLPPQPRVPRAGRRSCPTRPGPQRSAVLPDGDHASPHVAGQTPWSAGSDRPFAAVFCTRSRPF